MTCRRLWRWWARPHPASAREMCSACCQARGYLWMERSWMAAAAWMRACSQGSPPLSTRLKAPWQAQPSNQAFLPITANYRASTAPQSYTGMSMAQLPNVQQ